MYRLEYTQAGSAPYAHRSTSAWTFRSQAPTDPDLDLLFGERVPMVVVDYALPLSSATGPPAARRPPRCAPSTTPTPPAARSLKVWTSTDDGATWKAAPTQPRRGLPGHPADHDHRRLPPGRRPYHHRHSPRTDPDRRLLIPPSGTAAARGRRPRAASGARRVTKRSKAAPRTATLTRFPARLSRGPGPTTPARRGVAAGVPLGLAESGAPWGRRPWSPALVRLHVMPPGVDLYRCTLGDRSATPWPNGQVGSTQGLEYRVGADVELLGKSLGRPTGLVEVHGFE